MNLLITSAATPLAESLQRSLSAEHTIRLTERVGVPGLANLAICPLGADLSTNLLVRGIDAIIHVAEPLPTDNEVQQLDYLTRCTYNLCVAAAAEGVARLIYLNTLEVMTTYDPNYLVDEVWRPQPTTAAPVLAKHLGELTCREFAREGQLEIVSLRLGAMVCNGTAIAHTIPPHWLDQRDVIQAVKLALVTDLQRRWSIFHIQHKAKNARFSVRNAEQMLGFSPQYNIPQSGITENAQ